MKRIIALLIVGILILSLAACGATQNEATADSKAKTGDTIKIGYVNPTTGALAGNGEGCEWVVKHVHNQAQ